MEVISRQEAKAKDLTRYYTGLPCPRGHFVDRFVSSKGCTVCATLFRKAWHATPSGKASRSRTNKKCGPVHYRNNIEMYKAKRHARRARQKGAEGHYTVADLRRILEQQGLACGAAHCGVSFLVVDPTIDHKIPLSRNGTNWPNNLQFLCQPCNDSKGSKLMSEWVK